MCMTEIPQPDPTIHTTEESFESMQTMVSQFDPPEKIVEGLMWILGRQRELYDTYYSAFTEGSGIEIGEKEQKELDELEELNTILATITHTNALYKAPHRDLEDY